LPSEFLSIGQYFLYAVSKAVKRQRPSAMHLVQPSLCFIQVFCDWGINLEVCSWPIRELRHQD